MDVLTRGWSFFDVPALSRAAQSIGVWGGKIAHGWPLIIRHLPSLLGRFLLRRLHCSR
jgi:hypothetical protein